MTCFNSRKFFYVNSYKENYGFLFTPDFMKGSYDPLKILIYIHDWKFSGKSENEGRLTLVMNKIEITEFERQNVFLE